MALVITLIMLSVTLVMAVAFLALAKRERGSVTTAAETTTARLAADSALAAAQAQIAANLLATPAAAGNFGLLVSTNFINLNGFIPGVANVDNVNYDFRADGQPYTADDRNLNIANLYLSPRAPVFVTTNAGSSLDFRFYLDLNENGRFETNGRVAEQDNTGQTNGNYLSETGDPEWIGVLARPDQPHSADNPFVARYAFFAQPIGNSLDLNYIHNQTLNPNLGSPAGFFRNEGVGSWELNLAAFLTDLNTNQWDPPTIVNAANNPYQYNPPPVSGGNNGVAFEDAQALLAWRYYNYNWLAIPSAAMYAGLVYAGIDGYTFGNLMTNTSLPTVLIPLNQHWAGSDNTNHFFSLPSDVFDTSKNLGNFPSHLYAAGTGNSTYDRYTFYRMLAQLGTDSSPDDGKLNLNYSNAVVNYDVNGIVTNIAIVPGAETNLISWRPLDFFTAAADRMLKLYTTNWFASSPSNYLATYYGIIVTNYIDRATGWGLTNVPFWGMTNQVPAFGIANIPVQMNGSNFVYSSAINRVLQLAANLYDSSTTNSYPSVFRPTFWVTNQLGYSYRNVYINGYEDISRYSRLNAMTAGTPPLDIPANVTDLRSGLTAGLGNLGGNVYGVPWIIGAKKNLPAFNQLSLINAAQVTRKLMVSRSTTNPATATYWTNQMYMMGISNNLGISFWNSYNTNYPRPLTVYALDNLSMTMTNDLGGFWGGSANFVIPSVSVSIWPGAKLSGTPANVTPNPDSFFTANWTTNFLPTMPYYFNINNFTNSTQGDVPNLWQLPQFGLAMTNTLQAFILDGNNVIDYVQFRDPVTVTNLNQTLADPNYPDETGIYYQWSTNTYPRLSAFPSYGVINQLYVSGHPSFAPRVGGQWSTAPTPMGLTTPPAEAANFNGFFTSTYQYNRQTYVNSLLTNQAPYTPTRTVFSSYLLQANDPLVHYLASDLNSQFGATAYWAGKAPWKNGVWSQINDPINQPLPQPPSTPLGGRYQPWGLNTQLAGLAGVVADAYSPAYKDPLVWGPDYWDFPTNRYPSVGWIGRVHRGTPWQTVNLKSTNVLLYSANAGPKTWANWTGNIQTSYGQYFDAINSAPVQDRMLFDVFTTRFNDNAVRGTLSVNQTGLAAWSALFSGMVALSNNVAIPPPPGYTNLIISPAGVNYTNSALWNIVTNLNATRTSFVNADGVAGTFEHAGDILSVPALGEQSPFLNWSDPNQRQNGISDEVYEWLPQQMMGLVRGSTTPRYVVYCYGQTLKPAPNGLVTDSSFFKLCTNYQVMAESVVRAVVRVDKHATSNGTNYSAVVESYNVLPSN